MKPLITLLALLSILTYSCRQRSTVFELIDSSHSGIHFVNTIYESDSVNILDLEYVYNGGGVAIADFNNDGLQDIFFTGNMVSNKIYLNKGDMKFEDVSDAAGITDSSRWNTGVATIDINQDGLIDIYVCASIRKLGEERANRLYINLGPDKNGIPRFSEQAAAYGIADTGYSTNAVFFDYDNDGDLDLYVLTNKMAGKDEYPNQYRPIITDGTAANTDRLYRNDGIGSGGHPVFADVSKQAGIQIEGYGLGISIADINMDGWKDIYITNDFLSNDILYINNGDGTFTDRIRDYFKHTSYSAMGNDIADINNDGLPDIIAVDMLPESNYRKKMMMSANSYQSYMNNDQFGYQYQYGRNTLQLNMGMVQTTADSAPRPVFGDIAYYAGIAETDWSWTPMVCDFDNDGYRDIIITNGFPKDVTDHDFMTYRANASKIALKEELLDQIPEVKLANYAYRNNGQLGFTNVSAAWGLDQAAFSSGAAYGDLDNDGDLDCVISNINDKPFIYRNRIRESDPEHHRYLQVVFEGNAGNQQGIGAIVEVFIDSVNRQVYEHSPYRGYISTVQALAHFGLGDATKVDSIVIYWQAGRRQVLHDVPSDQVITAKFKDAQPYTRPHYGNAPTLFNDVTNSSGVSFLHQEFDFADFNVQKLLPHKLSEYGPGMAAGDLNGDGLDDLIIGGSYGYSATLLFQQPDGRFKEEKLIPGASPESKRSEDMGIVVFDADGDGRLDIIISAGSYESAPGSEHYTDVFYRNLGNGKFVADSAALPRNLVSKSCIRAFDFDKDGDLDLFVAGRVEPWGYPKPVRSSIYRNDSKDGIIRFTDITDEVAPFLNSAGLICDAIWTDFDNDGWQDLVLAGEWSHLRFIRNDKGKFTDVSSNSGLDDRKGWWNSIVAGDFDNDGDIDYVVSNLGLNSFYKASAAHPIRNYSGDFDNNNSYDAISSVYLKNEKGVLREFPAQTRDDMAKQMISMRSRFQNYNSFAKAEMDQVLSPAERKSALVLEANYLRSSFVRNDGNGRFTLIELPAEAQLSMINAMVAGDFDGDGNLDILMTTNDYGTEVSVGRYDALNGLMLKGLGNGEFKALSPGESGLFVPGNGKSMVSYRHSSGDIRIAATENRGPLRLFSLNRNVAALPLNKSDVWGTLEYAGGRTRKVEFDFGSSFLSQSARYMILDSSVTSARIYDISGKVRQVK